MCDNKEELGLYPIPGQRLRKNHFNYSLVKGISDPNNNLYGILTKRLAKKVLRKLESNYCKGVEYLESKLGISKVEAKKLLKTIKNLLESGELGKKQAITMLIKYSSNIERKIKVLYDNFSHSKDFRDELIQPTVAAYSITKNEETKIYTTIYFYENFKLKGSNTHFEKKDFEIYQNFEMGTNDTLKLTYYVCFKRTGVQRERGNTFRLHKFSIKNSEVFYKSFRSKKREKLNLKHIENVMAFVINVNPTASRGTVTTVKPTSN